MFQNFFLLKVLKLFIIDWILPLENETLQNYALRISENIKDENSILTLFWRNFLLKFQKIKKFKKVFLLSSAKTKF